MDTASQAPHRRTAEKRSRQPCRQFHGGNGYMDECDASISRIYGGSNEIMRMLIARSL
jgi:acyl-CoA dehydrogenase